MRSTSVLALLSLSLLVQSGRTAEVDLAHDLGVPVEDLRPREGAVPRGALERVARQVGCKADELTGLRVYSGSIRQHNGVPQACALVVAPLGAPARGGRVVFSVVGGCAQQMGLWGALDFDQDPTLRWSTFLGQLRLTGTREAGAPVTRVALADPSAEELDARLTQLQHAADEDARLAQALQRQRLTMRRNGLLLGMLRRGEHVDPANLEEMAREMRALAELSPALAALYGADGVMRHADLARGLAGIYADGQSLFAAEPEAEREEILKPLLANCQACHSGQAPDGTPWRDLSPKRRAALDLSATRLRVGFDVAPALGDDGAVSREIAQQVKAGILLLEALGS